MSEKTQSFYVNMALTLHAETASKAMEEVQSILTSMAYRGGTSKLSVLSVEIHTTGSPKPFEIAPGLGEYRWSSTDETEKSGS